MAALSPNSSYQRGLGIFCPEVPSFQLPPGLHLESQLAPDPSVVAFASKKFGPKGHPQPDFLGSSSFDGARLEASRSDMASIVAAVVTDVLGSEMDTHNYLMSPSVGLHGYNAAPGENCNMPHGWPEDCCIPPPPDALLSDNSTADTSADESEKCGTVCCNPGSVGHPDLCSRRCHYFASGTCSNGDSCQFCHMPHPKRPIRLDKANRSQLRNMSFVERASLMLPIMKEKVQAFGLSMGPILMLEQRIAAEYPSFYKLPQEKMRAKANLKVFRDVLKFRSMNSFIRLIADEDLSPAISEALDMVEDHTRQY